MNTKQLFKNLAIILAFSIGAFTFYSFTTAMNSTNEENTYDQSFYQDLEVETPIFNFSDTDTDKCGAGKCGDDKKVKKTTKDKNEKYGDGKCGDDKKDAKVDKDGKCGGDKKEAKKVKGDKKADEGKEAKCGTGKCG